MRKPGWVVTLLCCLQLTACSLNTLRGQLDEPLGLAVLLGSVTTQPGFAEPVRVAAWRLEPAGAVRTHDLLLRGPGDFELYVPPGSYRVLAFSDINRNGRADAGEPWAEHSGTLRVRGAEWHGDIQLALRSQPLPELLLGAEPFAAGQDVLAGALANLDAERFGRGYALDTGYWQGATFLREMGSNIHFLAPYDATRIPVLFVYGARGDPQDWRDTLARLDRSRFQPWLYYYPSGVPAHITSALLARKLSSLHATHRFTRLHIVAHSAGGLLVRRMLLDQAEAFPWVDRFVTVATPWGGESIAAHGLIHSPFVVPAWADLAAGGEFIRQLYTRRLPGQVRHLLLYGRRTGWPLYRADSDGSIPLSSLLDDRALAEVYYEEGFDETHRSILHSARFHRRLNALLAD